MSTQLLVSVLRLTLYYTIITLDTSNVERNKQKSEVRVKTIRDIETYQKLFILGRLVERIKINSVQVRNFKAQSCFVFFFK